MIVSVVFRNGAEKKHLRNWIKTQCNELEKYTQDITRVRVVISRISHHKKSSTSLQCHISVHLSGRKYIDIYEKHSCEGIAFNKAFDRTCAELSQQSSKRHFDRRDIANFLKKSETYLEEQDIAV